MEIIGKKRIFDIIKIGDNMIDEKIREMIGQRFILGLNDKVTDKEIKLLIEKYKIGGFIIYKKNYTDYNSMINFIKKLKKFNACNKIPLFISIDQEGGRVNRLPAEIKNTSRAFNLSKTKNLKIIKKSADYTSEVLISSGINMNLAPVLDIKKYSEKHVIGDRSFGENYNDVIKYGIPYFKEINKNILSVVKHFPGQGLIKNDSHYFLPVIEKLENFSKDIKPFEEAINNGCDAIMIGHMIIKDINARYPISFDKNFINELRCKYNYTGLLITDEIRMNSIKLHYIISNLIRKAFNSKLDIVLMKYKHSDIRKLDKLYELYTNNKYDLNYLIESYNRIINIKEKYCINDNLNIKGININKYNKEIEKFRKTYE